MSDDQRKYRNKATKLTQMDPKNIGYFSWNTMYCNVQSLFNWMFSLRERETLQQQVRANTERRRQSSRTWIVPEFHQLAIVTPHNPPCHHLNVKIQTKGIYMCLSWLKFPDVLGILQFKSHPSTKIALPIPSNSETKSKMKWKWKLKYRHGS